MTEGRAICLDVHEMTDDHEDVLAARGETPVWPLSPPLVGSKTHLRERFGEFRHGLLAGATEGAEMLSRLILAVADVTDVRVVLLDFRQIHIATASFLRESVLGFRDYCRRSRLNLYPVLANANLRVMEELEGLLRDKGDAVVVCETTERGVVRAARVIGKLEEKQRVTLRAVLEVRRADAPTLSRRPGADLKTTTAWNNRLVSLVSKGILMETSAGRNKVYQPVLEVLTHGN